MTLRNVIKIVKEARKNQVYKVEVLEAFSEGIDGFVRFSSNKNCPVNRNDLITCLAMLQADQVNINIVDNIYTPDGRDDAPEGLPEPSPGPYGIAEPAPEPTPIPGDNLGAPVLYPEPEPNSPPVYRLDEPGPPYPPSPTPKFSKPSPVPTNDLNEPGPYPAEPTPAPTRVVNLSATFTMNLDEQLLYSEAWDRLEGIINQIEPE